MNNEATVLQKENIKQKERFLRRTILNLEPYLSMSLDIISIAISAAVAFYAVEFFGPPVKILSFAYTMGLFLPLALLISKLKGVYDFKVYSSSARELPNITASLGVANLVTISIITLSISNLNIIRYMVILWPVSIVISFILRVAGNLLIGWQRLNGIALRNALIIGSGKVAIDIAKKLKNGPYLGYKPVGFVDSDPLPLKEEERELEILGEEKELSKLIKMYDVDHVIISFTPNSHELSLDTIRANINKNVTFSIVPRLFESLSEFDQISMIQSIPVININKPSHLIIKFAIKRLLDIICSFIVLILSIPMMIVIGILIKLDSKGPVFIKQIRCGKKGKHFTMFKFRSMVANADLLKKSLQNENQASGLIFKIKNDSRITRVGSILRKSSLDEFPQFFNVLKGDMSLVGPRPPLPGEVKHYNDWYMQRLSVKPGITGIWQVEGRSDLSFDEMVNLDVKYINNWSIWLDITLLLRTIPAVFTKRGAY